MALIPAYIQCAAPKGSVVAGLPYEKESICSLCPRTIVLNALNVCLAINKGGPLRRISNVVRSTISMVGFLTPKDASSASPAPYRKISESWRSEPFPREPEDFDFPDSTPSIAKKTIHDILLLRQTPPALQPLYDEDGIPNSKLIGCLDALVIITEAAAENPETLQALVTILHAGISPLDSDFETLSAMLAENSEMIGAAERNSSYADRSWILSDLCKAAQYLKRSASAINAYGNSIRILEDSKQKQAHKENHKTLLAQMSSLRERLAAIHGKVGKTRH